MRRTERPAGATHWDTEAGYYSKAEGRKVHWWVNNPQTHKREWKATSTAAEHLDWDLRFEELLTRS